jgi:GntR family transcriptional regulator/MocR family aminotransferase
VDLHVSLVDRHDLSGEIYRQLRGAIIAGRLRPGDLLPPTRELSRRLAVARTTVTAAYDRLVGEGFATTRVRAGTYVSRHVNGAARGGAGDRGPGRPGVLRPRPQWAAVPLTTAFDQPAIFDFRTGIPDATLFPHARWRRLMARELRAEATSRGVYAHPAGLAALREAVARHIGLSRGVDAAPDDVVITNGTQQAVDIVARVLVRPGDCVAVEDPGYPPPRWLLQSLGSRVVGVPVDREGIVVERLPRSARLVYVTPSHQWPLGCAMSLSRRLALLAWAERHDAAILEDDYDSEFRFSGRPIEPLQLLDTRGRVIYVGTFSKSMLPTLRLGFVVAPPSLRAAVHRAKYVADWHTSTLVQATLARFMEDGEFGRHLRRVGRVYAARHELVTALLARDFADQLEVLPSPAGLHVAAVARRASARRIRQVVARAAAAGVAVQELARFGVAGQGPAGVLLGYGAIATGQIEEGLRRLRAGFDSA